MIRGTVTNLGVNAGLQTGVLIVSGAEPAPNLPDVEAITIGNGQGTVQGPGVNLGLQADVCIWLDTEGRPSRMS